MSSLRKMGRKSSVIPLRQQIDRRIVLLILLYLGIGASPHLLNFNRLFAGIFFFLLCYRAIAEFYISLKPGRLLLFLLTFAAIGLIIFFNKGQVGSETGVSLLLVMAGLKLLEIRTRRDIYFTSLLGFFILITVFLFENGIAISVIMLISAIGLISILINIHCLQKKPRHYLLMQAVSLTVQALPLTLAFFFLFPRLGGPLWSFDSGERIARTGLSDSVTLGSINRLIQSKETAFRVEFVGPPPPPKQRYWRGPVMWQTDGVNWSRSETMMQPIQGRLRGIATYEYTVFLEANDNHWLILLDVPAQAPARSHLSLDYQVITKRPVSKAVKYHGLSYTRLFPISLSQKQRELALQLPNKIGDRVRQLAKSWQNSSNSNRQIVQKALHYFRQQRFIYTLTPPLLKSDPIDSFLFETKRGFCEHYAASFTLLMRLAGIPSRMVTGYLGGEINPHADYMIIRQSDAHAWSEVWLDDQGWLRIDPTAAVAPERIEQSLDIDFTGKEGSSALFHVSNSGIIAHIRRNLRWGLDAINLSWHRWILGYDRELQRRFVSEFGIDALLGHNLALYAVIIPMTFLIMAYVFFQIKGLSKESPIITAYAVFLSRMAKLGIAKLPYEGPLDFEKRACKIRPDISQDINLITSAYIGLRYSNNCIYDEEIFARQCKAFHPRDYYLPMQNEENISASKSSGV